MYGTCMTYTSSNGICMLQWLHPDNSCDVAMQAHRMGGQTPKYKGTAEKNVGAGCPIYPDPNVDIHMQFQPYILMIMCPCLRSFREKNIIPRGEPSNDNHGSSDMIDMLIVIIYIIYNTNII